MPLYDVVSSGYLGWDFMYPDDFYQPCGWHTGLDLLATSTGQDTHAPGPAVYLPYPGTIVKFWDTASYHWTNSPANAWGIAVRHADPLHPGKTIYSLYWHLALLGPNGSMKESLVNQSLVGGVMYPAGTLLGYEGDLMSNGSKYISAQATHVHFMLATASSDSTVGDSCASTVDPSLYVGADVNYTTAGNLYGTPIGSLYGLSTAKPKIDLVFAIDTTGSMIPYLDNMKADAYSVVNRVLSFSDAQIGVVDYRDLYSGCPIDGYAARVDLGFSSDTSAILGALNSLSTEPGIGCDTPESVYSGLMTAIRFPWRPGVKKAIILMGDAPPHDPEPVTHYTLQTVVDAANAVDPASIYAISIGGGGDPYFGELASETGGAEYTPSTADDIVPALLDAATGILSSSTVSASGSGSPPCLPGNNCLIPEIGLTVSASPETVAPGGSVTYTYDVANLGTAPLSKISLSDAVCSAVTYASGDTNGDEVLQPGETWTYTCSTTLTATTVDSATVSGTYDLTTTTAHAGTSVWVSPYPAQ